MLGERLSGQTKSSCKSYVSCLPLLAEPAVSNTDTVEVGQDWLHSEGAIWKTMCILWQAFTQHVGWSLCGSRAGSRDRVCSRRRHFGWRFLTSFTSWPMYVRRVIQAATEKTTKGKTNG